MQPDRSRLGNEAGRINRYAYVDDSAGALRHVSGKDRLCVANPSRHRILRRDGIRAALDRPGVAEDPHLGRLSDERERADGVPRPHHEGKSHDGT
jgi:hypothetical protein